MPNELITHGENGIILVGNFPIDLLLIESNSSSYFQIKKSNKLNSRGDGATERKDKGHSKLFDVKLINHLWGDGRRKWNFSHPLSYTMLTF